MRKFILLALTVLSIVSCERNDGTVAEPNEQEVLTNENYYKKEADSTEGRTFTSGTETIEGLDPKDITPPRR